MISVPHHSDVTVSPNRLGRLAAGDVPLRGSCQGVPRKPAGHPKIAGDLERARVGENARTTLDATSGSSHRSTRTGDSRHAFVLTSDPQGARPNRVVGRGHVGSGRAAPHGHVR